MDSNFRINDLLIKSSFSASVLNTCMDEHMKNVGLFIQPSPPTVSHLWHQAKEQDAKTIKMVLSIFIYIFYILLILKYIVLLLLMG